MNSVLEINGKKLHSIKDAVQAVSYSRDHITRLAREKKIIATFIGKQWYIDLTSLQSYEHSAKLEQQVRTERLSVERKRALKVKEAVSIVTKQHDIRARRAQSSARVAATAVCMVGLLSGVWLHAVGIEQFAAVTKSLAPTDETSPRGVTLVFAPVEFNEHSVAEYKAGQATIESKQFGSTTTGVFLIPQNSSTTNPAELVSDPVAVVETPTGQAFVKVDANGVPYGQEIPFIVVPVPANVVTE